MQGEYILVYPRPIINYDPKEPGNYVICVKRNPETKICISHYAERMRVEQLRPDDVVYCNEFNYKLPLIHWPEHVIRQFLVPIKAAVIAVC